MILTVPWVSSRRFSTLRSLGQTVCGRETVFRAGSNSVSGRVKYSQTVGVNCSGHSNHFSLDVTI